MGTGAGQFTRPRKKSMALIYLLDTNILSELEKQKPNSHVEQKVASNMRQCAVASISWHELWYGYHRLMPSKRQRLLKKFLEETVRKLIVLPYTDEAAEWHAKERSRLSQVGRTPAFIDGQIAAVAAVNNLTLVTRNVKDFADFQGIEIENWFEEI